MDVSTQGLRFGAPIPLKRCPYCGVARPQMLPVWTAGYTEGVNGFPNRLWGGFRCTSCGQIVLAAGMPNVNAGNAAIREIFPGFRSAPEELPETARKYLQQAYETLHAPDAAAVMAGSAVDAMLKAKGYVEGSLYARVDEAVANHILTKEMGDWAHWVRLGSNRPRHADKDTPHVTPPEAQQSVEFVQALGEFLFVLSSRIERGIEEAQKPPDEKDRGHYAAGAREDFRLDRRASFRACSTGASSGCRASDAAWDLARTAIAG